MTSKTGPAHPWISRCGVLILDLAVFAAACRLSDRDGDLQGLVPLLLAIVVYGHDRPFRWRSPSLLLSGVLVAGAFAWVMITVAATWGSLTTHLVSSPWPLFAGLVPGHLLVLALRVGLPAREVRLDPTPGTWRLARRALRHQPGRRYRLREDAAVRLVPPAGPREDRDASLATPWGPLPLHPEGPREGMGAATKRTIDLLAGTLLLVPGLPTILIVAVLVRLTSRGPAFYSQERITTAGRSFRIHKIRSMVVDAEPDGRPVWPEENDPRITPLGRTLRRYWIDELPQLLNVLRGELSLIGPRPERPAFVKAFSERLSKYPLRHQVTAGMTGLAQVMGYIGNTSLEGRLRWDLRYVMTWSPALDVKILFLTGWRMLRRSAPEEVKELSPE